jgi:murein DD-endopeptidase MepM/ murein hydrolase activator NlpD
MQLGFPYGDPRRQRHQALQFKGLRAVYSLLIWFSVIFVTGATKPAEAEATKQKTVRKGVAKGKTAVPSPPIRRLTNNDLLPAREARPFDLWDRREHIVHRIRSGDTLPKILDRFSLPTAEKELWGRSIRQHFRSGKLAPGRQVHFYFAKPTNDGKGGGESLMAVELDFNDAMDLTWEKSGRAVFFARREKPVDVELRTATATIDDSLFTSGMKAGIHASLLSQLADIFTWDVDLEKDIYQGDSFKILYEQRSPRGQSNKAQLRILAAELINAGQKMTAIYFEKQKGMGAYYNAEGRSLARSFLRFPLEFTNISSRFTESRFHPVLKTNMPHTGVDFAAQRGTPVRAVGDGMISHAGWNGSYGKLVEIQHDASFTTRYAHLDGYGDGIRSGTMVKKGQVIGFVGSTGRSTGPHLHFELYKDQQYINPFSLDFPAEDTIEPALLRLFEDQKNTFLVELTSLPQS